MPRLDFCRPNSKSVRCVLKPPYSVNAMSRCA